MLVVESVVPGGPADGVLEPGDVLVRLQGQVSSACSSLLPLFHHWHLRICSVT